MSLRSREATVAISMLAGQFKLEIAKPREARFAMTPFYCGILKVLNRESFARGAGSHGCRFGVGDYFSKKNDL